MSTENPHLTGLHTQRWRPTLVDGTGQRLNPRPTAHGPQTALVVGPEGETTPGSSGPVHCDALGCVRGHFHWQAENDSGACWIRVGQAFAGKGFGAQFLPRSGQEVLVHFVNGDIDRPIISKALYNGRGEGGVPPTPGGAPGESKLSVYENASDQRPSAEANLAGGNSPAWHGGGAGDNLHRNAAALSGFKTQGFDGNGHNQLVFDDSDQRTVASENAIVRAPDRGFRDRCSLPQTLLSSNKPHRDHPDFMA